jgi:hypothetical protein
MRKSVASTVTSSPLSFTPMLILAVLIAASAGLSLFVADKALAQVKPSYYRLQLKHGR